MCRSTEAARSLLSCLGLHLGVDSAGLGDGFTYCAISTGIGEGGGEEVGMAFDEVGMAFDEVGMAFDEVSMAFDEVGMAFDEVGIAFDEVGMALDEVRLLALL